METNIAELRYTLENIDRAVNIFWEKAKDFGVIAFSGEMGAGKTTFIHHLCDYLKVKDNVSSPTFALINEYHFASEGTDNLIYHMDWYRLKDAAEAINAGMEDCLLTAGAGGAICLIEWPEKAKELLVAPYLWLSIEESGRDERTMNVTLVQAV